MKNLTRTKTVASGKYECALHVLTFYTGCWQQAILLVDYAEYMRLLLSSSKIKACLGAAIELTVFDCVEMLSYILFYMYNK